MSTRNGMRGWNSRESVAGWREATGAVTGADLITGTLKSFLAQPGGQEAVKGLFDQLMTIPEIRAAVEAEAARVMWERVKPWVIVGALVLAVFGVAQLAQSKKGGRE
jgi:hypothetical protein